MGIVQIVERGFHPAQRNRMQTKLVPRSTHAGLHRLQQAVNAEELLVVVLLEGGGAVWETKGQAACSLQRERKCWKVGVIKGFACGQEQSGPWLMSSLLETGTV